MKKYVKPELLYERYELLQHIAAGNCNVIMNASEADCSGDGSAAGGFENMFTSSSACTFPMENSEDYCYTAGAEGAIWTIFGS